MNVKSMLDQHSNLRSAGIDGGPSKPGLALSMVSNGAIIAQDYRGLASLENRSQIDATTRFHTASLAKQFTALAVLQLRDAGLFNLADPVQLYLPELQLGKHQITVQHLLTHTSGIRDQWPLMELAGWRTNDTISTADVMQIVSLQKTTQFEPGSRYMYSNTGYTLLAQIISRVAMCSFSEYMNRQIFAPLGMEDTFVANRPSEVIVRRADAYRFDETISPPRFNRYSPNLYVEGSTSLFTTMSDYTKWILAHSRGTAWRPYIDEMWSPQIATRDRGLSYGFGYFIREQPGSSLAFHSGVDFGFTSYFAYFKEVNLGIALFANSSIKLIDQLAMDVVGQQIPELAAKRNVRINKNTTRDDLTQNDAASTVDLEDYCGTYESSLGEVRRIEVHGDHLYALWGATQQLTSVDVDSFITEGDERYIFVRNALGSVEAFHQSSIHGSAQWKRLQTEADTERESTHPTFTGFYLSGETRAVLEILESDSGRLSVILPKQSPILASHLGGNLYAAGTAWFRITQNRNRPTKLEFSSPRCLDVTYWKVTSVE